MGVCASDFEDAGAVPPTQQTAPQPSSTSPSTPIVRCPRCHTALRVPPNAPIFRCVCGMNLRYDAPAAGASGGAAPPVPPSSRGWRCQVCHHPNAAGATQCALCVSPPPHGGGAASSGYAAGNTRRVDSVRVRPAGANAGGLTNAQREQSFAQRRRDRAVAASGGGGGAAATKQASGPTGDGWTQSMATGRAWVQGVPTLEWQHAGGGGASGSAADDVQSQAFIRRMDSDGTLSLGAAEDGTALIGKRVPGGGKPMGLKSSDMMRVAQATLEDKSKWFKARCEERSVPWQQGHQKIKVKRSTLLLDSFRQVSKLPEDKLREVWRIEFLGEPGRDAGGLTREWFTVVSEALFNPDIGLFKASEVGGGLFSINPESGLFNEHHLEYFEFAGRFFGKALFEDERIVCPLAAPIYKHILGSPLTFADLMHVDRDLHSNLIQLLETEGAADIFCLDFTVQHEFCGSPVTYPLKEGGEEIEVDDENKAEYVSLVMQHYLLDAVSEQLKAFLTGFYASCGLPLLSVLDFQELELLLNGLPTIDVDDWQKNSIFKNGYSAGSKQVKWFFNTVRSMTLEQQARLLQFATGTARVPIGGFKVRKIFVLFLFVPHARAHPLAPSLALSCSLASARTHAPPLPPPRLFSALSSYACRHSPHTTGRARSSASRRRR